MSFLSKKITGAMNHKATCNQFAVCFFKGSFNKLGMVISTCSSGSEKLRQEDCGFEGSLGYNSRFQASLAIYIARLCLKI